MSRRLLLMPALVVLLAACQSAEPPAATAPPAPEPVTKAEAAPAEPAPEPAREVPVGECGDQSGVEPDQRIANTPRWSTASELDNFGFDVYRAEAEDGEFVRLTETTIQGAGTSDEPHSYSFRDDSIDPCQDYWYYVEAVSTSGHREKFTPTFRAPAKRRAAETE